MAVYVKSMDPKHLVEIGLEGFYGPSTPGKVHFNPNTYAQQVGTDFIRNHQVLGVDFASVHIYADSWWVTLLTSPKLCSSNMKILRRCMQFCDYISSMRALSSLFTLIDLITFLLIIDRHDYDNFWSSNTIIVEIGFHNQYLMPICNSRSRGWTLT